VTTPSAPAAPPPRLSLGVTGHRRTNAAFCANEAAIGAVMAAIATLIGEVAAAAPPPYPGTAHASVRLHSMLADGTDQIGADLALAHGWELVAPLPFGPALTAAAADGLGADGIALLRYAHALAANQPATAPAQDGGAVAAIDAFFAYARRAEVFALSDRDRVLTELYERRAAGDAQARAAFEGEASHRYTVASRVIIEQSDLLIAVWDGTSRTLFGGTGHTISTALEAGVPVIWIPPAAPERWRPLYAPEDLSNLTAEPPPESERRDAVRRLAAATLAPDGESETEAREEAEGIAHFLREQWRPRSNPLWHGYRRIEAMFGEEHPLRSLRVLRGLGETYATPLGIIGGAWRGLMGQIGALPGLPARALEAIGASVAQRFAWADGLATHLSDAYRRGMILNFALSAMAAIGGLFYLPYFTYDQKWLFAIAELTFLIAILVVTEIGRRRRWHGRWFEMRRVAEYLRHTPILLALGAARPAGRWLRGFETSWPEWYARQALRQVGLPAMTVTEDYLRAALTNVLRPHVVAQRDYHVAKSTRLQRVHDNLDRFSSGLLIAAILVVALYVSLKLPEFLPGGPHILSSKASSQFTFFGVALPLLGATIAGIRYFGDFERFSAISEVAAEKLDQIVKRVDLLLGAGESEIDYDSVSRLAHAMDDVVVAEIESWQAVFGGKHITVPV
jgi:hypothetical protein